MPVSGSTTYKPVSTTCFPDGNGYPIGFDQSTFSYGTHTDALIDIDSLLINFAPNVLSSPSFEYDSTGIFQACVSTMTLDDGNSPIPSGASVTQIGWGGVGSLLSTNMRANITGTLIRGGGSTVIMRAGSFTNSVVHPVTIYPSGVADTGLPDGNELNALAWTVAVGNTWPQQTGSGEWGLNQLRFTAHWQLPDQVVPPLRQWQRNDGMLDGSVRQFSRNGPSTVQNSIRQGPVGTYL